MATSVSAIPLDGVIPDDDVLQPGFDPREAVEQSGAGSRLAMQQLGLLASPREVAGCDHRLEDWIASQIDLSLEIQAATESRNIWNQLVEPAARTAARIRTAGPYGAAPRRRSRIGPDSGSPTGGASPSSGWSTARW